MLAQRGGRRKYIRLTSCCFETASGLSILFPSTNNGMPSRDGLLKRSCNSFFEIRILSLSAASTTYLPMQIQAWPTIHKLGSHPQLLTWAELVQVPFPKSFVLWKILEDSFQLVWITTPISGLWFWDYCLQIHQRVPVALTSGHGILTQWQRHHDNSVPT